MGICRWFGLYFHDWVDYNGVAFLIESLEWGRLYFLERQFFIFSVSELTRMFVLYCRWKVKCALFNIRNGSIRFRMTCLKDL